MTFAFWCVLAAILLPYGTVGIAKWSSRYDNHAPRDWLAGLEGRRKRAFHAHLNHFEALPAFASGVVIAHLARAPQGWVDGLAGAFVLLRVAYTWAYLEDRATLRSILWIGGLACVCGLFVAASAGS
ncbi:MAG TPA: MAPEG family protein [Usitatibacteraceae bacterium]|jgi:uncharacterized MAPEG superfamily protein|nr:MAPEG family protein [Usitatibacteraceae bacterium]